MATTSTGGLVRQEPHGWARALRFLWRSFRILAVAYLGVLLLLMWLETKLVYPAISADARVYEELGQPFEDVVFTSADGTRLHGWLAEHPDPRGVLLFCHGNGGNVSHRAGIVDSLRRRQRLTVFVFDYRGYGLSGGAPAEAGIVADARAARAWLAKRAGVSETDVILLGNSLGGGVAVDLAVQTPPRAMILQNTFTSLPAAAAHRFPIVPTHWFMRNRFDSLSKIPRYQGPLLQLHGDLDPVIPFRQGEQLHAAATAARLKRFVPMRGQGHVLTIDNYYHRIIDEFLTEVCGENVSTPARTEDAIK